MRPAPGFLSNATANAISVRNGEKKRTTLFLDAITRAQLDRLAHRKRYSVTAVIEELAASADRLLWGLALTTWTSSVSGPTGLNKNTGL